MSPIANLSDRVRMPRLGKIHLGIKVEHPQKPGTFYPRAVDYFVCPEEIQRVYGPQPRLLKICFPVNESELFAPQYLKLYSRTRGLVCRGDGITANQLQNLETHTMAHKEDKKVGWKTGVPCLNEECEWYKAKACRPIMNLQFLLPHVPGLGVWQLDTSSINSIKNINSGIRLIDDMFGRVAMIPANLTVEPREVSPDGKKKNVYVLHLRVDGLITEIRPLNLLRAGTVSVPEPEDDFEPADGDDEYLPNELDSEAPEMLAPYAQDPSKVVDRTTGEIHGATAQKHAAAQQSAATTVKTEKKRAAPAAGTEAAPPPTAQEAGKASPTAAQETTEFNPFDV